MWNELWANEIALSDLRPGQIIAFVKSSIDFDGPRGYGLVDAIISELDGTPITHLALVSESGDADTSPWVVHSNLNGICHDPLHLAAVEHVGSPVFVFGHRSAVEASLDRVVEKALARHEEGAGYPMVDLLLGAFLLRLRIDSQFDEQLYRSNADVVHALSAQVVGADRTCAAFVSRSFDDAGMMLEPPSERSAFDYGLARRSFGSSPFAARLQHVAFIVGTMRRSMRQTLEATQRSFPELEELLADAMLATKRLGDKSVQLYVADWLLGDRSDAHELSEWVFERAAVAAELLGRPVFEPTLTNRFMSVHDLLRSPSIEPLGHVRGWADTTLAEEATPHDLLD